MSKRDHKKKVNAYKAKVQQKRQHVLGLVEQLEAALEEARNQPAGILEVLNNQTPLYITGLEPTPITE